MKKLTKKEQFLLDLDEGEIFKRIYIKTESDLPEPNEGYIVHYKGGLIEYFCYLDHPRDRDIWMKNIDWYLLPLK